MADVTKTIDIIFQGIDNVSDSVTKVGSNLGSLSGTIESIAAPFAAFADGVLKADAALATMAAGGIALAINESAKFGASFNEISSISSATGDSVNQFKDQILEYSQSSTKSIDDITKSVYSAISAGVDYKDALGLMSTAEKLSVAGKADLEQSTMLLVSTMNAYGASTSEAAKYSDVFFQTVKLGQTTVPELAASLSNVSGIAATAGVPIETLGAALAALTVAGVSTSESTTALKAALSNIISPSSEASKAADALGIQFNATSLKTKGFEGVLKEVYTATGGNIDKMAEFFGSTEALNAVMVLASDKAGMFKTSLDAMASAAGSTDAAFKVMADSLSLATQNLENNFKVVLIKIGDEILPKFAGDVDALSNVFKSISISVDQGSFDPLFNALNGVSERLETFLNQLAGSIPEAMQHVDFSDLVDSLQELGEGIGGVFDEFDPSNPQDVADAIQFVVDSISSLVEITTGMVQAWGPFIDGLINSVSAFNSLDDASKQSAGNIAGSAKLIVDAGGFIVGALMTVGQNADTMKAAFDTSINGILFLWDSLKVSIDAFVITIIDALQKLLDVSDSIDVFGIFSEDIEATRSTLDKWKSDWQDAFIDNANSAREHLTGVIDGIADLGSSADETGQKIKQVGEDISQIPTGELDMDIVLPTDRLISDIGAIGDKLTEELPNEKQVNIQTKADEDKLKETQETIAKAIPDQKNLEIQAKIEIANIEAEATKVKAAYEAMASVSVAKIEADAKRVEEAFKSIGTTVESTGKLMGDMIGALSGRDAFTREYNDMMDLIEEESENRKEALDLQRKLTEEQVAYMKQRRDAMSKGDALIKISADGLEAELEAFMWKILERIQVRVAEEQAAMLLGLDTP